MKLGYLIIKRTKVGVITPYYNCVNGEHWKGIKQTLKREQRLTKVDVDTDSLDIKRLPIRKDL